MVRRLFWATLGLGAGVTTAVMTSRWMRRQADRMAPANIGRQAGETLRGVGELFRQALADGRAAMREREAEIRESLR